MMAPLLRFTAALKMIILGKPEEAGIQCRLKTFGKQKFENELTSLNQLLLSMQAILNCHNLVASYQKLDDNEFCM